MSLNFSTILSFTTNPALIIAPNTAAAVIPVIISRRFGLNLISSFGFCPYLIPFLGHKSRHFKHLTQVSLSTFFSLEFIQPDGQFFSHIPQDTQLSLSMYILLNENFEISPSIVPAGQIFVQKNLFLKNVKISITAIAERPVIDRVKADPKYV